MTKKILFITGSYPPDYCGMADVISRLMDTPIAKKFWEVYYRRDWKLTTLLKHINDIKKSDAHYILMQWPTRGYGKSVVPHLLCVYFSLFTKKKFGVIIHEQSQLSKMAYLALLIILFSANKLIFTNQFERNYAVKRIPFMTKRSTVVKIQSNITIAEIIKPVEERNIDVIYFGFISPNKGIERFIGDTVDLSKKYRVAIVGQVPSVYENYYQNILLLLKDGNIETKINLEDKEVSSLLNDAKIAYLPFPDGVSERRGSFFAAAGNGAVVVTTIGRFTTPELEKAVIDRGKTNLADALSDIKLLALKQQALQEFMKTQMPSWEDIANSYSNFIIN